MILESMKINNLISPQTCFVCGGKLVYALTGKDFLYKTTRKNFRVYRCSECKLERILPVPSEKETKLFYPESYYSFNMNKVGNERKGFFLKLREKLIETAYNKAIKKDFLYFLSFLAKIFFEGLPLRLYGKRNFLDVGCGDGYNLDLLKKYGWKCYGFEKGNKGKVKNIYFHKDIYKVNFSGRKFDYIRIWHVLEHVPNPKSFLEKIYSLMSDKGKVLIGVPNTRSLYSFLFGKYWYNRDIPRHVTGFNKYNLERLLTNYGLEVISARYISAGGFVGSLQHYINDKFDVNINPIGNTFFVLLAYPLDMVCNFLKIGDCLSLTARRK